MHTWYGAVYVRGQSVINDPQYSSSEFQDFAMQYEFQHVPRRLDILNQMGKRNVRYVKTAMRNMKKALNAKAYPYLAMLEHKNTPSEGMSTSPAQRLFGRRKRSTIPTSRQLLEPICMHSPKQELQQAKTKRAYYYNRRSKKLLALMVGDAVRRMPEKGMKSRRKGKVKAIASPRSYIVETDDGGNYEEIKRRHLRKTVEPDIEFPMKEHDLPDRQLAADRMRGTGSPSSFRDFTGKFPTSHFENHATVFVLPQI